MVELDIRVDVVVDGGSLFRGAGLTKAGVNRVVGDHVGVLATVMSNLAIRGALHHAYVNARLMLTTPLSDMCDSYSWAEAIDLLRSDRVVILLAGTGNPFFAIDSAACLHGIEIEASVMLKITKVDGIFTADPVRNSIATMYEQLTCSEMPEKELKIMDLAAFTFARNRKLPIHVSSMNRPGVPRCVVVGEREGTLIMK